MKKILGLMVAVLFSITAVSFAAEEQKAEETPARKAAVEKCTKDGHTGTHLNDCVDKQLQAEKTTEKKVEQAQTPTQQ